MQTLIAHEYMDKFTGRDKLYKALDKMTGDVDMTCNTEEFAQILAKRYVQKNESTLLGRHVLEKQQVSHKSVDFFQILCSDN